VARRVAHDYGNIFTGILGFAELSLGHPSPSSALVQSYLQEVYRSAQNGAGLTHQLRLFSRRRFLHPNPSSLPAALHEVQARLPDEVDLTDRLQANLPDDLPPLAMDAEHVRHVLGALLDNALEATAREGAVTVSAEAASVGPEECGEYFGDPRPGPHVFVEVADTGPGLSPEARQRVLVEPFYTSKPRHRGLGLAVAYGVLHAHKGGLRLLPGREGGVRAQVLIPVAVPASVPAETAATTAVSPTSGGEKVLVVDDDPLVLNFVRATLEQAGYRVQAVTNATEALTSYAAAAPEPFRLVLSDVLMPRVTGVDLARSLLQRDANVKLLFMSGQPAHELVPHDTVARQFELLAKPFRPEGLLRAVRSALDRPAPWTSSAPAGTAG
jgi:CheY-like chemotaxis protein